MWNIIWTYFICHDSVGLFSSCFQRAHTYTRSLGTKIFPDTLTVSQFSVLELRLCACVSECKSIWYVLLSRSLFRSHTHIRHALNFYVVCELSLEPAICKFCISLLSIFFLLCLSFFGYYSTVRRFSKLFLIIFSRFARNFCICSQ